MTNNVVYDFFREAISIILVTSAPMMIAALVVGLLVSIFQATTQIQEQTLAFVPKIITIFVTIIIAGPWIMDKIANYTLRLFEAITMMMQTM